jgi:hypothetical protein
MTEELLVSPDIGGRTALPRRNGPRGLLPTSWTGRAVHVQYRDAFGAGQETSATLLDWCRLGVVVNIGGARTILAWDRIALLELAGD